MIKLRKMGQTEFENYYPESIQNLAAELAKANRVLPDEMLNTAKTCFDQLLPERTPNVPGEYLYDILFDERKIGIVWFGIRKDRDLPEAYIWEIFIEPESIGQGYGRQAMTALEKEVRALGINRISLNVFAHNEKARNFYENLGYETISSCMLKCM